MTDKIVRTRSPNYPVVGLGTAIELAAKIEKYAQRHPAPAENVIDKAWKFKPGGSYGFQCIGALKQFGLLEELDGSKQRMVKLTEAAAKIIHNHPERQALVRMAAMKPKLYATILARFPGGIPPDETIKSFLLFDHTPPFNPATVGEFLKQFRNTMAATGLDLPGQGAEDSGEAAGSGGEEREEEHDQEAERRGSGAGEKPPKRPPLKSGMTQAVFPLEEGEALLQMPAQFSQESYEDFEAWVALVLKKAKRSITTPTSED
jgi:hypothetical protein